MTDEMAILELVGSRGGMTISANRESYMQIHFQDGKWSRTDGDPMTGEESTGPIDEAHALICIRSRVLDRKGHYGPDRGEVSPAEILKWLRDNPFS